MAYNEELTARIREALSHVRRVEEKKMFRGVTFMVNGKMCISAGDTLLMCRIDPAAHETAVERPGVTTVKMKGRDYIGFVYVDEEGYRSPKDFQYWIDLCLAFNKVAKATPQKSPKKTAKKIKRKSDNPKKGRN